jgi:hypothetical protein
MTKPGLSTEHPKWLHKAGHRSMLAQGPEHETELRDQGFSHEQPIVAPSPNWQNQQLTANAGLDSKPAPGTVPTSVMDAEIENLKTRFDAAWDRKCKELDGVTEQLKDANDALHNLKIDHDKLVSDHATLIGEHAKLLTEQNALLAAQKDSAKPAPVKPPVAAKA